MPDRDQIILARGTALPGGTPWDHPGVLRVSDTIPGVYLLPRDVSKAGPTGRPPNGYAVVGAKGTILVDAVCDVHLPIVDRVAMAGRPVKALVLSHAHVCSFADAKALRQLDHGGCRLVLAEAERDSACLSLATAAGLTWHDPADVTDALASAGLEVLETPGHTIAHVSVYRPDGVLLAGDAAVGDGPKTPAAERGLLRPPPRMCVDEPRLAAFWRDFDRPIRAVLPLHGTPYTHDDARFERMLARLRDPAPCDSM